MEQQQYSRTTNEPDNRNKSRWNDEELTNTEGIENEVFFKSCPRCGSTCEWNSYKKGWIKFEVDNCQCRELVAIEDQEMANKRFIRYMEKLVNNANIPDRYFDFRVDTYPIKSKIEGLYNLVDGYINDYENKTLTLYGNTGTGKTAIATIITREIISKYKIPARFTTGVEMAEDIFHGIKSVYMSIPAKDVYAYYTNINLLVIDDFSIETSAVVKSKMFGILNDRYNKEKATIITTNLMLHEITNDSILIRLWERLKQKPNRVFIFDWQSLR